jgi:glycine oxidase
VIGCSVAYHLAGAGFRITVVERGKVGGGASGVAAGMVAALSEAQAHGEHLKLALQSRALHLELLPRLQEESGIDVEYLPSGVMHLAFTPEDEERLRARTEWQEPLDMGVRWLSAEEAHRLEPGLADEVMGAPLSPQEGHLNSGRLVRALAQGVARRGGTILQDTPVVGLLSHQGRVTGVRLPSGDMESEWVVVASGAWAGQHGGWLGVDIPVRPVRGQILAARTLPCPISRVVWHGINYLVPKADGSIVMGTTTEEAGFRDRATLQGIAGILRGAIRLVPAVADWELRHVWAGLRPGTPDGLPILGPVPGLDGVLLTVGHFRSGILFSAVTGKLIYDYIAKGDTEAVEPFSLSRFAQ